MSYHATVSKSRVGSRFCNLAAQHVIASNSQIYVCNLHAQETLNNKTHDVINRSTGRSKSNAHEAQNERRFNNLGTLFACAAARRRDLPARVTLVGMRFYWMKHSGRLVSCSRSDVLRPPLTKIAAGRLRFRSPSSLYLRLRSSDISIVCAAHQC